MIIKVKKQVWRCAKCIRGVHEFYTPIEKKQSVLRRLFCRSEKIKCPVCKKITAKRNRVVTRTSSIPDPEEEKRELNNG